MTNVLKSKIAKAGLGLFVAASLALASQAGAMTTAEAQALVAALGLTGSNAQMVLALATPATTTTTTTSGSCYQFTKTLAVGSKGADVTALQTALKMSSATGYFGNATKAAVMSYQTSNGLSAVGMVGPATRAKLNASCTSGTTTTTTGGTTTGGTTTTGAVTAMLSSDNPASGTVIQGQAAADLLHVTLTGNGTVNSVTLNRGGISDQSTLTNVYLFDGATRLTDGYSFNNAGTLTMSGLNVAVNGTKNLQVKADVSTTGSPYSVSVSLASFSVSGATVTSGLNGNLMYVAGNGTLASANLTTASPSPVASSVNPGAVNQSLWNNTVSIGLHATQLKGLTLKMIGSAPTSTLANVSLFVDGVKTVSSTVNTNSQFVFDLSSAPYALSTGSHLVEVRGDVVGGAYRNFYMSLEKSADLVITDPQTSNVAVLPTYLLGSLNSVLGGLITINQGSLTINQDPAFSSTTTLVGGATGVKMAAFKVTSYGEDVKVNSLTFTPTLTNTGSTATATTSGTTPVVVVTSGGTGYVATPLVTISGGTCSVPGTATATISGGAVVGVTASGWTCSVAPTTVTIAAPTAATMTLANVGLYVNGGQVGGNQTATSGSPLKFDSLGTNLIVSNGSPMTVELKGDIMTSGLVNLTAASVKFDLAVGSNNAQGVTSGQLVSTQAQGGQTLTVASSNVTFAQTTGFAASTIAPNTSAQKIGSFTLSTGSAEGVTLNNILVNVGGTMLAANQITNLKVMMDGATVGTPIGNPTASNNFSVSLAIPASTTKTLVVYGDIGSSATGLTVIPGMAVTYRGATSNVSTTTATMTGATLTSNVAQILAGGVTYVPQSSLVSQFIVGGANGIQIGTFNFATNNGVGGALLKDVTVTVPANTISSVTMNGVTNAVVGTTAVLRNVGITVPADAGGIDVPMTVSLVCVNATGGCSGVSNSSVTAQISTVTYNDGSTIQTISPTATTVTHKLVASKPTVSLTQATSAGLSTGNVLLGTFTVAADAAGNVKIEQIPVNISNTSSVTGLSGVQLYDSTGNTVIVGSGGTNGTTVLTGSGTFVFSTPRTITHGTSETYTVYGTVAASGGLGSAGTSSVTFSLGAKNTFHWTDVVGAQTGIVGDYLNTYPTGTITKTN